jgi:hypothetical protein
MALPWARMDTNIASHDKILALANDPSSKRFQALSAYLLSIPWSVGAETDGRIPAYALKTVFATPAVARLLVKHRLWSEETGAWRIVNFDKRNPTAAVSAAVTTKQQVGAAKGNCRRWHGDTCWRDGRCSREAS